MYVSLTYVFDLYVSLTYPFNIVQHTLSHIVEHCKLDSLATPDNIVWSTVMSPWTSGGGGGVSESMDGRECAILALEVVPKNLIFT